MSIDPALKQKAIRLRLEGKSYTEILKKLQLKSKGTLSVWFHKLKLPKKSKMLLKENIDRATKHGLLEFNKKRSELIQEENNAAYNFGLNEIRKLNDRELLLLGAALYWGEGTKYERKNGSIALVFTNSDPDMIFVFMKFLRQILKIPEERIRAGIHMYSNVEADIRLTRLYWSKITNLPADRFYISQLISVASSLKRDKNGLPYGTLVIRINDRKIFFRVKGMMKGLIEGYKK